MSPSFPNRNVPFKTRFLWGIAGGSMIRNPTSSTEDTGSSPDPRWSHRPHAANTPDCQEKYQYIYADDTNLMEESKEKLKSLSMKMKEESEKV